MESNETVSETTETPETTETAETTAIPEEAVFTSGFALKVEGQRVYFSKGGAGAISVGESMEMDKGGAMALAVGRDLDMTFGGGQFVAVGRDLTIENGGAQILTVGGKADITNGGAMVVTANEVNADHANFGIVLARSVTLNEGSKVMISTPQAAAMGVAFGAVFAVLGWLLRRR